MGNALLSLSTLLFTGKINIEHKYTSWLHISLESVQGQSAFASAPWEEDKYDPVKEQEEYSNNKQCKQGMLELVHSGSLTLVALHHLLEPLVCQGLY